jgi:PncC family amidohydrolase
MPDDQELAELFGEKGMTLALAESCTGGMVAARITALPGCSVWFKGGVVAYHNDLKQQLLKVPLALLEQFGAVSEQVACAMAEGARSVAGADLALAVTGIAGPDGGSPEKPVGSVYLALADHDGCVAKRYRFKGDRAAVRQATVEQAFSLLKKRLEKPEIA